MKTRNFLMAALAAAMMMPSCHKDGQESDRDVRKVEVRFSPNINVSRTKAAGNAWAAGDAIGVFMVENATTSVTGGNANKKYVAGAAGVTGNFAAATPEEENVMYYPEGGEDVDFIACYPYRQDISTLGTYPVNVATQSSPADIDLLYARTSESVPGGYSKTYTQPVPLAFKHQLSRLALNVTSSDLTALQLQDLQITLAGLNTTASFALADGTLSSPGNIANIVPYTVTAGARYEAIVLPQAIDGTTVTIRFVISSASIDYTYTVPAVTLEKGKEYQYTADISSGGSGADVTVTGTIDDWEQGDTGIPPAFPQLVNASMPFAVTNTGFWLNSRFGTAEGWTCNAATGGITVDDSPAWGHPEYDDMMCIMAGYNLRTPDPDVDITNAKIHQALTLPAGTYQFKARVWFMGGAAGNVLYLVAAKGADLPDTDDVATDNNVLGYAVENDAYKQDFYLNCSFTLTESTEVLLGIVANVYVSSGMNIMSFSLTKTN
ncbi:MAG: fimbrillin family protein [Bacteroidales bacterium]|jgi:hypothetical protein|nr:fimbrillin family protein [Bacteroidales bacterium]